MIPMHKILVVKKKYDWSSTSLSYKMYVNLIRTIVKIFKELKTIGNNLDFKFQYYNLMDDHEPFLRF